MPECIFCQIIQKKVPSRIVFEDDISVAFLDINPANPGHIIVIPKEHRETLLNIPVDELKKISANIQAIAVAALKSTNASGFNILQNNGQDAGQLIPHVHFHIIPRFKDDGLNLGVMRQHKMEPAEMDKIASRIKSSIIPAAEETKREVVEEKKPREKRRKREDTYFIRREIEKT